MCQSIGAASSVGFGPKTSKVRSRAAATRAGLTVGSSMLVCEGQGAAASAAAPRRPSQRSSGPDGPLSRLATVEHHEPQRGRREAVHEADAALGDHDAPAHARNRSPRRR